MIQIQYILIVFMLVTLLGCANEEVEISEKDLSSQFLLEVKRANPTDSIEAVVANLNILELENSLQTDAQKKAFWLNMYNAWYQTISSRSDLGLDSVFIQKLLPIAGDTISFDELEHGILRAKAEYEFANLAVDSVDYRIHFALNCGAKSCPPIAFYDPTKIDDQLERATKLFLTLETDVDETNKIVHVTQLMEWFAEDFGGEEGVYNTLEKYLGQDYSTYAISYKPFDWTQNLANFSE